MTNTTTHPHRQVQYLPQERVTAATGGALGLAVAPGRGEGQEVIPGVSITTQGEKSNIHTHTNTDLSHHRYTTLGTAI
ncbi:hypothetical protein E2C01_068259 [Portunus trituberculatus]|uniref:Uncharacterized protein n=1 Tax=Portunus trituberculatus TaxID=210409 RepID=A0A5B7HW14_PORTR|nr:hypothetical protein [Portunus trituberculatus]